MIIIRLDKHNAHKLMLRNRTSNKIVNDMKNHLQTYYSLLIIDKKYENTNMCRGNKDRG